MPRARSAFPGRMAAPRRRSMHQARRLMGAGRHRRRRFFLGEEGNSWFVKIEVWFRKRDFFFQLFSVRKFLGLYFHFLNHIPFPTIIYFIFLSCLTFFTRLYFSFHSQNFSHFFKIQFKMQYNFESFFCVEKEKPPPQRIVSSWTFLVCVCVWIRLKFLLKNDSLIFFSAKSFLVNTFVNTEQIQRQCVCLLPVNRR